MECNFAYKYTYNTTKGGWSTVKILSGIRLSTPSSIIYTYGHLETKILSNIEIWYFSRMSYHCRLSTNHKTQITLLQSWYSTCKIITNRLFSNLLSGHKNCFFSVTFILYPASISNYCFVFTQANSGSVYWQKERK